MKRKLGELESLIGYRFQRPELLEQALWHRSFINEMHLEKYDSNERLEFLGDAVLEMISSEFLFFKDPQMLEGSLTKLRASLVCEPALAACAQALELGSFLRLGKGEEANGGRERDSLVADGIEAVIGAIYVDGGFANAKEFVLNYILKDIGERQLFYDSKTILQETVQGEMGSSVSYRLVKEEGPDHEKRFIAEVLIDDQPLGLGEGKSKKAAEQDAAYQAILKLRQRKI